MSSFEILVDRLQGGKIHRIDLKEPSSFLGPSEEELKFGSEVMIQGEAYLTDEHLIIRLKAKTEIQMPCAVCNEPTRKELKVDHFYHAEPIENIRGAIFDYGETLREALLIELPKTIECHGGKCPERSEIESYFRSEKERSQFPFAHMDQDLNEEN